MSASSAWIICSSPIGLPNWLRSLRVARPRPRARPARCRRPGPRCPGRDRSNVCIAIAKPSPSSPSRFVDRDADAVERQLRRRRAADAHLVLEPGDLETGRSVSTTNRAQPPAGLLRVRVRHGEDDHVGRRRCAWLMNRFEPSMTYSSPSRTARVRMPDGSEPASASVSANAMSCSPDGEVRQPALLLLVGAGDLDRHRAELLDGEDEAARRAHAAELLDGEAQGQQVGAEAAVFLRERQRRRCPARRGGCDVVGPLGRPVDLGGAGRDRLVGQLAGPRRGGGSGPP